MDAGQVRTTAKDLLGLSLTEEEAAGLVGPLTGLRQLVELVERVPLPFSAQPFITPGMGDRWLAEWPDPTAGPSAKQK